MKILLCLLSAMAFSVYADVFTGVYNNRVAVQCNGWGWTGQRNFYTVWKNACSPLETQGGDSVDSSKSGCRDRQTAIYTIDDQMKFQFEGCK